MPLTLIPQKQFLELLKNKVSEANIDKKPFKWNEMLKHSINVSNLIDYMNITNCKYVGEGSSRIAFMLPSGAYGQSIINEPSCFKVAKKLAGRAQNNTEINIMLKYGKKYDCFPKLFEYDKSHKNYMLCELGAPVKSDDDEMIFVEDYFDDWKEYYDDALKNNIPDELAEYLKLRREDFILNVGTYVDFLNFVTFYGTVFLPAFKKKHINDKIFNQMWDIINALCEEFPEYSGMRSVFEFLNDVYGTNDSIYDLGNHENWAWVSRNNVLTLIPIDFGLDQGVLDTFYCN